MKIFLSGLSSVKNILSTGEISTEGVYILESFAYWQSWEKEYVVKCKGFLLDSGAYTFRQKAKNNINWNEFVEKYAAFIKENDIRLFFELDIDSIIGYDNVLKLRAELEKQTNRPSIPVWHPNRGKEDYIAMCQKYDYVAIGGIAGNNNKNKYIQYFPWFISTAHKYGSKLHGLGFTDQSLLPRYKFDSVDSVTWLSGAMYGTLYKFNPVKGGIDVITPKNKTTKRGIYQQINAHNFNEWCKFQRYAESKF